MTARQKQLGLVLLIAFELAGAVLVLRWAFGLEAGQEVVTVWAAEDLPPNLARAVADWVASRPGELTRAESLSAAALKVSWHKSAAARPLADVVLVPVARFSSLREQVAGDELRRAWLGSLRPADTVSRFFVSPDTAAALDELFGPRGPDAAVTVVPASQVVERLWAEPAALALVPFDRLDPRLKPLAVDGSSALDRALDLRRYPLLARVWVAGPGDVAGDLAAEVDARRLDTNRHLDRLTMLLMTGATALTRHLALEMDARGDPAWPARDVAGLLSAADLTHVSNEVSFVPGCAPQNEMPAFCARPEYLDTLRLAGVDLVELTGNHNLDFGPECALYSLDLYAGAGMEVFGGGRDAAEARRPLLVSHNGNRLAFLGYNRYGPDYAWATADGPGAARFSPEIVRADVAQIRDQVDLVFVSIQYTETYETEPLPAQVADFRACVDAGADVVLGSQAHQPQAIEFYAGRPLFYGLGNLFFDQTWSEATRQSLVLRHFVYEGRLVAVELVLTVADDGGQPHVARGDQRAAILQEIFAASGW